MFEGLINNNNCKIPNGYKNLEWNNSYVFSPLSIVHPAYFSALTSEEKLPFNGNEDPMSTSVRLNSSFEIFNGNLFVAAVTWNNDLILLINDQRSGRIVYNTTVIYKRANDWPPYHFE